VSSLLAIFVYQIKHSEAHVFARFAKVLHVCRDCHE
jgi:hypothetical protein